MKCDVLIIGGGPGGYPAAFKLAAAGKRVVLAERGGRPGGVCLHRGCIPSKALLHAGEALRSAAGAAAFGVEFGKPVIDVERLRGWQQGIINQHADALARQVKRLKIEPLHGTARLLGNKSAVVALADGATETVEFEQAIIATGSEPIDPGIGVGHARIIDSTGALALADIPERLLVVGGGYIGLELGQAYAMLGSRVTVVEMMDGIMAGVDRDLAKVVEANLGRQFEAILTGTKVVSSTPSETHVKIGFEGKEGRREAEFDRVLVSVGRRPNSAGLGLEQTAVKLDKRGFIETDAQKRTSEGNIFAIGDVAGQPMLAHKATHEGLVAADVILGVRGAAFDPVAIPGVVFTDPELAWCGLTETEAQAKGQQVKVGRFPWSASGRASTLGRSDGLTKVIADPESGRLLGVGIAGPGAGELIAAGVVALEMGAVAEDIAKTIHPHPTLSETLMEAAAGLL